MTAILIYWILQIAVWIACIFLFVRRKEIARKHHGRKDPQRHRIFLLIFVPIFAFGYACLGGFPPQSDQVYFILAVTVLMYGVLVARWIRQDRSPTDKA